MSTLDPMLVAADLLDPPIPEVETDWRTWLGRLFPSYVVMPFAPHHEDFWEWVWAIDADARPSPFVGVWPRGGAKSTSAEAAVVALAARRRRRYGLYVCETQDQADDHVSNVAAMLESDALAEHYSALAQRAVGKYGHSRGWRRNRLRTSAGFTLDAIGLDTAARGVKLDEDRPDLMVFDDLDGDQDSAATVAKKTKALTRRLIPAGASSLAVIAIQNLVHPDSLFAQLVDGRADFLGDRIVSGPIPALEGLTYEQRDGRFVITAGVPTWEGMDFAVCQELLDDEGLTAFLAERQHDVEAPAGGMFDRLDYRRCRWGEVPWDSLLSRVVWVDPAVTDTDSSDSMGIQADALAADGTIYRLWSWEARTSPLDALSRALRKARELEAVAVGVETDQGGDTWRSVYREAAQATGVELPFRSEKAGAGFGPKAHRAAQMLADYERGRVVHVEGTHLVLERALNRFPMTKPLDLVDAAFWSWHDLRRSVQASVFSAADVTVVGTERRR